MSEYRHRAGGRPSTFFVVFSISWEKKTPKKYIGKTGTFAKERFQSFLILLFCCYSVKKENHSDLRVLQTIWRFLSCTYSCFKIACFFFFNLYLVLCGQCFKVLGKLTRGLPEIFHCGYKKQRSTWLFFYFTLFSMDSNSGFSRKL